MKVFALILSLIFLQEVYGDGCLGTTIMKTLNILIKKWTKILVAPGVIVETSTDSQIEPELPELPDLAEPNEKNCPKNSNYQSCGSPCPPTCQNRNPVLCPENCRPGCFCNSPYIQISDNNSLDVQCVLKRDCPQVEAISI